MGRCTAALRLHLAITSLCHVQCQHTPTHPRSTTEPRELFVCCTQLWHLAVLHATKPCWPSTASTTARKKPTLTTAVSLVPATQAPSVVTARKEMGLAMQPLICRNQNQQQESDSNSDTLRCTGGAIQWSRLQWTQPQHARKQFGTPHPQIIVKQQQTGSLSTNAATQGQE